MIRLLAVATAVVLLASAASAQELVLNPNYERDVALLNSHLDGLLTGDFEAARAPLADTFVSYGPAITDSANADQTIATWQQMHQTYRDLDANYVTTSFRVPEGPHAGNWVGAWGLFTAHHNRFDRPIRTPVHVLARVDDGQIVQTFNYWDNLSSAQQLGATLQPPQAPASE